jgi:hypothetical protein
MHFDRLLGIGFVIGLAGAGVASTLAASGASAIVGTFAAAEAEKQVRATALSAVVREAAAARRIARDRCRASRTQSRDACNAAANAEARHAIRERLR